MIKNYKVYAIIALVLTHTEESVEGHPNYKLMNGAMTLTINAYGNMGGIVDSTGMFGQSSDVCTIGDRDIYNCKNVGAWGRG